MKINAKKVSTIIAKTKSMDGKENEKIIYKVNFLIN